MLSRFSCIQLFVALWTVVCQAPLSMGSPLPYWSGLPCPPLGDLPDSGCVSYISCIGRWVLYHLKMKVKVTQSCPTLWPRELYSPWNSPGQNTGVGSLSLLQGLFPTQGSKPGLCIAGGFFTNRAVYHVGSPKYLCCCSAIRNMITTVFVYLKSFESSPRLGNECNFIYGPTP